MNKKGIFHGFSSIALEEIIFENFEKNRGKLHYQNLITLVLTQKVKYEIFEGYRHCSLYNI